MRQLTLLFPRPGKAWPPPATSRHLAIPLVFLVPMFPGTPRHALKAPKSLSGILAVQVDVKSVLTFPPLHSQYHEGHSKYAAWCSGGVCHGGGLCHVPVLDLSTAHDWFRGLFLPWISTLFHCKWWDAIMIVQRECSHLFSLPRVM